MQQKQARYILGAVGLLLLILLLRGRSQTGKPTEVPPPLGEWSQEPLPGPQPEGPFYRDYPCDTGLPGVCAAGKMRCTLPCRECAPTSCSSCVPITPPSSEICDGDDDDCDGQIDNSCHTPQCRDGINNDADIYIDHSSVNPTNPDPGCDSANDDSELPQCSDGSDNDGDGRIDRDDPGCYTELFPDEYIYDFTSNDEEVDCEDGEDNDGDGSTDMGDPGCAVESDDDEHNRDPLIECDDGIDNDGDGYADYPYDEQCVSSLDRTEHCVDGDADRYFEGFGCGTSSDCNDADAAIHPGALDICDCVDNNCNTRVDENLPTGSGDQHLRIWLSSGTEIMGMQATVQSCGDRITYQSYTRGSMLPADWFLLENPNYGPNTVRIAGAGFTTVDAPIDFVTMHYRYENSCTPREEAYTFQGDADPGTMAFELV